SGNTVRRFSARTHLVHALAFSPDGRRLAGACWDGVARVWDAQTGKELHALRHADRVLSVAFSPDGRLLVSAGCDNVARVWDAATGKEVATLRGHIGYVMTVGFSPDGKTLATASGHRHRGEVQLWETAALKGGDRENAPAP